MVVTDRPTKEPPTQPLHSHATTAEIITTTKNWPASLSRLLCHAIQTTKPPPHYHATVVI
ncbi:hypothetical protein HanIR_Chr12g0588971 [Helianthus annuus]|nr:hypothetical protein HanIR_Chr12g0588971 [Helianthus annuus]